MSKPVNWIRHCLALFLVAVVTSASAAQVFEIADRDADALAAAIHHANRSRQPTTIRLAQDGLYTLVMPADDQNELGLPIVSGDVTLIGNNADLRRYAVEDFALLAVADGGRLRIEHLTLAEGSRGALINRGEMTLDHVRIIDNVARNVPAIIENYGQLRVLDSAISFNQLAGAERDAGTLLNFGTLTLAQSTIESNWISRRYDTLVAASAVLNLGKLKLSKVRVRDNFVAAESGDEFLGAIVNFGNGHYDAEALTLEGNEPVDTVSVARLLR